MCVLNMSLVDTRPGANAEDPFCPPGGFKGTGDDYLELCRERFATDIMFGQRMLVISRYAAKTLSEVVKPASDKRAIRQTGSVHYCCTAKETG